MQHQTFPMTQNGAFELQQELERLKTIERPKVIQAIAEARSHGDLSENAEYDAAKNRQAFVEGKIADIEAKLSRAQIIDPKESGISDRVIFGVIVKLLDYETNETFSYQIVGDDEANIKQSKISINSPLARSLIGKEIGAVIEVHAPSRIKEYEILDISI